MSGNERKFFVPIIGKGGRPKGSEPGEVSGNIKEVKQREKTWGENATCRERKGWPLKYSRCWVWLRNFEEWL